VTYHIATRPDLHSTLPIAIAQQLRASRRYCSEHALRTEQTLRASFVSTWAMLGRTLVKLVQP